MLHFNPIRIYLIRMKKKIKLSQKAHSPVSPLAESAASFVTISLPSEFWTKEPSLNISRSKIVSAFSSRPESARNSLILSKSISNVISPQYHSSVKSEKLFPDNSKHQDFIDAHRSALKKSNTGRSLTLEKSNDYKMNSLSSQIHEKTTSKPTSLPILNISKNIQIPLISLKKQRYIQEVSKKSILHEKEENPVQLNNQEKGVIMFQGLERHVLETEKKKPIVKRKTTKNLKKKKKPLLKEKGPLIVQRFTRFSLD